MNYTVNKNYLFLNSYVILDDGTVNSLFFYNKSKVCFGYLDFNRRIELLKKELKKEIFFFYELKEEYLNNSLYFNLFKKNKKKNEFIL